MTQEEQAAWQKLWSEVKQLSQDAKTRFLPVEHWQGTLTGKQREQIDAQVREAIAKAEEFARSSPPASAENVATQVYA